MNKDWVEKDFYKTLGVTKTASDAEIKKAYRKLAQQYHPDTNPGDTAAEARFKDVSEAYATLSDTEKRTEYDNVRNMVGSGGFTGFGGQRGTNGGQRVRVEDLSDLFGGGLGDIFGFGGAGGRTRGPQRGADINATLRLSFDEAVRGITTSVGVDGDAQCRKCRGNGAEPGTSVEVCPTCGGTGVIAANQGVFSLSNPCPQCRGSGRIIPTPCSQCRGTGQEKRTRTIKVRIPPGVKNGSTIGLNGKGNPGANGGPAGNLLITLKVDPHPVFDRKGNHLTVTVPITFTEAALGAKIPVPTLTGSPVTLKIPAGTNSGKTFRVPKKGVKPNKGKQGDLLVTVEVIVPEKLSRDAKRMLEQFRDAHENEDPRGHLKVE